MKNNISILLIISAAFLGSNHAIQPQNQQDGNRLLVELKSVITSVETRVSNLETTEMSNIKSNFERTAESLDYITNHLNRVESILTKLQLTDQEKRKWCHTDYGKIWSDTQKSETERLEGYMELKFKEIDDLVRVGISKMLRRFDSLVSEGGESTNSEVLKSIKDNVDTLLKRNGVTGVQVNSNSNTRTMNDRSMVEELKSSAESAIAKMAKQSLQNEARLANTVMSIMSVPSKLSQASELIPKQISELQAQLTDVSSNSAIVRLLRYIHQKLQQVDCAYIPRDNQVLIEKALSTVNEMINTYSRQLVQINNTVNNVNLSVTEINQVINKYNSSNNQCEGYSHTGK